MKKKTGETRDVPKRHTAVWPKGGGNLNSINQCLVALGAPTSEVCIKPGSHTRVPRGRLRTSIYDRMGGKDQIWYRAKELYREGMKRNHPDKHNGAPEREERCKELSKAYLRAKQILRGTNAD